MKKLLGICLLLSLVSCRKTYQCTCTTTIVFKNSSGNFETRVHPGTKEDYHEKLSKKQAIAACDHMEEAAENSAKAVLTNNGAYTLKDGESIASDCLLTQ